MKIFDGMKNFFESIGEYVKNFSNLFLIFLGAFVLVSVIVIIITSFAYECKLTKTIDKINKFLERNPRINDDNLVAFNNMMKANGVPKILRRQWQQFMLYREHPASYYMSFKHCVENPLRNSTYRQQMTVYKIISYVLVALSLVVSTFMAVRTSHAADVLQEVFIIPATILVLYWVISMVLDLIHNAVSGDLFQNYQYFEINMDKAMLTLPEFVDYEVLFSQDEIRRGIPVLYAYLQKRAIQEQQELEKARLKSVDHEKFDFNEAGLDGSLVLDRAMHETENYTTQRKKYLQEIERVNNEISVLENNYKEQTKEFQRQVQTSKETVENLKEQLEQAGSTIEINYIKKQMRDEINRQQEAEREFDILTDKHNQSIKSLNQEIKRYEDETKKAKEAMEVAMLSEFSTYSVKVYDNLEKIVDEKMQDRVDEYKDQIKGLEIELEEKNEELESVYTRYQEVLSQIPEETEPYVEEVVEEIPVKKGKKKKKSRKGEPEDDGVTQPEQVDELAQYGENAYAQDYYPADAEYVDNQYDGQYDYNEQVDQYGDYVPMDDNQGEYIPMEGEYVPQDQEYADYVPVNEEYQPADEEYQPMGEYVPLDEEVSQVEGGEYVPLNEESAPVQEVATQESEEVNFDDSDFDIDFSKPSSSSFEDMDFSFDFSEQPKEEKTEPQEDIFNIAEPQEDGEFDLNKALGLYDSVPSTETKKENKVEEVEENAVEEAKQEVVAETEVEEKPKRKAGRPRKVVDETSVAPKRKVGRPRKIKEEVTTEDKPKRKAGRPRKVVDEAEATTIRKVGRPRKVKEQSTEEKPKRKVGRPRKNKDTEAKVKFNAGAKRGRPRKNVETVKVETETKRRGRPRKEETNNSSVIDSKGILGKPKHKAGRPRKNG